jgi:hypothetical protein
VLYKYGTGWWCKFVDDEFMITSGQVNAAIGALKWIGTPPPRPVRISRIGKHQALPADFQEVPFETYLICDNLYQGFTLGVSAKYQFIKGQKLAFQICNSPLSLGIENVYAYNFGWIGSLMPWWETIWTFNLVEDSDKRLINYIALGNHFQWGSLLFDLDFLNRASFRQDGFFLTDYSVISKVIWNVGKWNICAKGGYEENSLRNVDAQGRAFDNVIAPGTKYIYAGAGLEYFPLGLDKLRLHAVYYLDNDVQRHNFDIGLTWKVSIIGK